MHLVKAIQFRRHLKQLSEKHLGLLRTKYLAQTPGAFSEIAFNNHTSKRSTQAHLQRFMSDREPLTFFQSLNVARAFLRADVTV